MAPAKSIKGKQMNLAASQNHCLILVTLISLLAHQPLFAGLTQDSQFRKVEAEAGASVNGSTPPDDSELVSSAALGRFVDDAFADVIADNGLANANGHATAELDSLIQLKSAEGLGIAEVAPSRSGGDPNEGGAFGAAVAEFTYQFTVDTPTNYNVLGEVFAFGIDTETTFELRRADDFVVFSILAASTDTMDDSDLVSQTDQLAPGTYTLSALADTVRGITGLPGAVSTTAGAEFSVGFSLDVVAPGEVVNGTFLIGTDAGEIFGWTKSGLGSAQLLDVGIEEELVVLLQTGSPIGISQNVDTFAELFALDFDYQFLDTTGSLDVSLDGQTLLNLPAPGTLATSMQTATIVVSATSLRGQTAIPLEFVFDGPSSGLQLRLDNVALRLAADLNGDGMVDGNDLTSWENAFGPSSTAGDVDGNGDTDGNDFLLWQQQFNAGSPNPLTAVATAVPEPTSEVVGLLACLSLCTVFRRRQLAGARGPE